MLFVHSLRLGFSFSSGGSWVSYIGCSSRVGCGFAGLFRIVLVGFQWLVFVFFLFMRLYVTCQRRDIQSNLLLPLDVSLGELSWRDVRTVVWWHVRMQL